VQGRINCDGRVDATEKPSGGREIVCTGTAIDIGELALPGFNQKVKYVQFLSGNSEMNYLGREIRETGILCLHCL